MQMRKARLGLLFGSLLVIAPGAHAQFAVIDVASVAQLVSEVRTLEQQVVTARSQLLQAQEEFQAITGPRGMQQLLAGTVRNYLPRDWTTLQMALQGTSVAGGYSALGYDFTRALGANSILSAQQLAAIPPSESQSLQADRRSVALLQVLSRSALANSSARFDALQQLIDTIGSASDQKAILELQARIGAEAGMLQNEHTKVLDLYQGVQADRWANLQRTRELVVAGHGQFGSRFQPHP